MTSARFESEMLQHMRTMNMILKAIHSEVRSLNPDKKGEKEDKEWKETIPTK